MCVLKLWLSRRSYLDNLIYKLLKEERHSRLFDLRIQLLAMFNDHFEITRKSNTLELGGANSLRACRFPFRFRIGEYYSCESSAACKVATNWFGSIHLSQPAVTGGPVPVVTAMLCVMAAREKHMHGMHYKNKCLAQCSIKMGCIACSKLVPSPISSQSLVGAYDASGTLP